MLRRLIDWLWFRSCKHEWEPYFYGRVLGEDDLYVVLDVCTECGATIARSP